MKAIGCEYCEDENGKCHIVACDRVMINTFVCTRELGHTGRCVACSDEEHDIEDPRSDVPKSKYEDMRELIVNGRVLGVFSCKKKAEEHAANNNHETFQMCDLGTFLATDMKKPKKRARYGNNI